MTRYRSLLLPLVLLALSSTHCNDAECEAKRDELTALKDTWTRCETSQDCIKFLGNSGDCSGILSCNFAGNRRLLWEAERRIASLPEETTDCLQCNSPNCVSGDIAICDPLSQRCMLVTTILDGGVGVSSSGGSAGKSGGSDSAGTGGTTDTGGTEGTADTGGTGGTAASAGSGG